MAVPRCKNLTSLAKGLRKNMTREERHLWYDFLRYCTPRFRRQEVIGNYIADFYCHMAKLVVELDGSQHLDPQGKDYDTQRTAYFNSLGIDVVRYYNTDVHNNFRGVCDHILMCMERRGQSPAIVFSEDTTIEKAERKSPCEPF